MRNYSDSQFFDAPFRGVTSVLNAIFGNKFENSGIPEHVLKIAGERGTAVHSYLENYQKWLLEKIDDEPHLGLEYAMYETNFKEWLDERCEIVKILATEQRILSPQIFMKGILDAVWTVKNKDDGREYTCLIDFKTSSNLDMHTANLQMQLYYYMLVHGNKEERELASKISELRVLSLTKTNYSWYKFNVDLDLAESIIYLWNIHYINEAFKTKKLVNPEIWKDIKGYEGLYEISNFGRVRSHIKIGTPTYYKTPILSTPGYYTVVLSKNGKTTYSVSIHRLVAEAFVENTDPTKTEVNHKDGDKLNNYYKNLEWVTRKENNEHAIKLGLRKYVKPIEQYTLDGELVNIFNSSAEAGEFLGKGRRTNTHIINCCKGKITTAYGYKWRYADNENKNK